MIALLTDFRILLIYWKYICAFVEKQAILWEWAGEQRWARERRLKEKCDQVIRNNTDKAYVVRCWTTENAIKIGKNSHNNIVYYRNYSALIFARLSTMQLDLSNTSKYLVGEDYSLLEQ